MSHALHKKRREKRKGWEYKQKDWETKRLRIINKWWERKDGKMTKVGVAKEDFELAF